MPERIFVGSWEVDPAGNRIRRDGQVAHVEPKVMDLLVALASRPGEVVSREALLAELWRDTVVSDEALTTAVYQLRRALGDHARAPRWVETVPKRGYRLIAPVGRRAPAVPAPTLERPPNRVAPPSSRGHRQVLAAALALVALTVGGSRPGGWSGPVAAGAEDALVRQARASLDRWGPDAVASALAGFEEAVARDPSDPLALAGLAESLVRARSWALLPPEQVAVRARQAAEAAVALGPELAATHRALAFVRLSLDWDFAAALAGARRALALDPDHAGAHALIAQLDFIAGRGDRALAGMARARRSAPGSPAIHGLSATLASALGRSDLALHLYRRALELDPRDRRLAEVVAKLESVAAAGGATETPAARDILDRVAASAGEGQLPPWQVASLYAELGERDPALEWLDRAWKRRDPGLFLLRYDSRWAPYREHPRVRAVVARLSPS